MSYQNMVFRYLKMEDGGRKHRKKFFNHFMNIQCFLMTSSSTIVEIQISTIHLGNGEFWTRMFVGFLRYSQIGLVNYLNNSYLVSVSMNLILKDMLESERKWF